MVWFCPCCLYGWLVALWFPTQVWVPPARPQLAPLETFESAGAYRPRRRGGGGLRRHLLLQRPPAFPLCASRVLLEAPPKWSWVSVMISLNHRTWACFRGLWAVFRVYGSCGVSFLHQNGFRCPEMGFPKAREKGYPPTS